MPDKPYNVAERFQEVRRRAEDMERKYGRPGAPPKKADPPPPPVDDAYATRPGASMRKTGDVHLESPAVRALKRKGR